jgi:FtsH-binding integral membrane protein
MSKMKDRPTIGTDGVALPILPPDRDARVWAKLVRVMFYTPGFLGLLLIKTGEPASFGITVELLMLASAAAIVGGLYIGTQSSGAGADESSKVGTWSGCLVLELLGLVPFLCAVPALFHELAHSTLLHSKAPGAVDITLGASELLPAFAILPFMLYQLSGFGTLYFIVSKPVNWAINIGILCLIVASYVAFREGSYGLEKRFSALLVVIMALTVLYGVLKLKRMQTTYDAQCPSKAPKEKVSRAA